MLIKFNRATGEVGPVITSLGARAKDSVRVRANNDGWIEQLGCFSPSSRYLYMMTSDEDIYQFDVSLPPSQIRGSIMKVTEGHIGQVDMQVAIDGKIYFIDRRNYQLIPQSVI